MTTQPAEIPGKLTLAERWARFQARTPTSLLPLIAAVAIMVNSGDPVSRQGLLILFVFGLLYWERMGFTRLLARKDAELGLYKSAGSR